MLCGSQLPPTQDLFINRPPRNAAPGRPGSLNQAIPNGKTKGNVICNAEPFGGGPGATLDAMMPYLRDRLQPWGPVALHFVGSGYSLAFQRLRNKPEGSRWDELHDIDLYTKPEQGKTELTQLCERLQPVLFVTVMDANAAGIALAAGCRVVVIDLLLWWWPKIPTLWPEVERVVAADFYGLKERIAHEKLANVVTVPPLGPPPKTDDPGKRKNILLNFGGLQNPYIPLKENIAYAQLVYNAARRALDLRNATCAGDPAELITLTASTAVARGLVVEPPDTEAARTVLPDEALALMGSSELVCCTSGLGNLYGAAAVARDVFLLPPTSATQGIQCLLAEQGDIHMDRVDWHDLTGGEAIKYDNEDPDVFKDISKAQQEVISSSEAQTQLAKRMFTAMKQSAMAGKSANEPALRSLIRVFGQDSGDAMAANVVDVLKEI